MSSNSKKAFTLIELLAVIVILAVIALISSPIIINLIENARKESFKDTSYGIISAGENLYAKELLASDDFTSITFTYTDGVESSSIGGKELEYNGAKPRTGTVIINEDGKIAIAIHNGAWCTEKGYDDTEVTLSEKIASECVINEIAYDIVKGVNKPKLATGMTPVKWNGTTWVNTTESDSDWYNYTNADKKWANAKTADGSFWVWIPRYVYRISTGWHTGTAGTIDIQFSMNTDDTRQGTVTLDTGTTANASNNKWTNHPAFTFGTTQVTGIWVAKFEISGNAAAIDVIPNVTQASSMTFNANFTAARNMETNGRYGWGTSGTGIDTHMMKNIEWGAVAYLSKSTYGKNATIWNNPSSVTGCAGDNVNANNTGSTCSYPYNTPNGQQASTTGNVYGVYDMNGGEFDLVAAYVNNGDANLTTYGSLILSADAKYKDVYQVGAPDDESNNYALAINKKGDAMYETSYDTMGHFGWYNHTIHMMNSSSAFLYRGNNSWNFNGNGGLFSVFCTTGTSGIFRPIVLINDQL